MSRVRLSRERSRTMMFGSASAAPEQSGDKDPNYRFYRGEISSQPDGDFVDNIHTKWDGDNDRLEYHHGYIQWLFPVFENAGMNFQSSPLSKTGAALIRADADCCRRVIKSYRLILRFYGFALVDERTGALQRHPDGDSERCAAGLAHRSPAVPA
jgi:hypothetical protein